MFVQGKGKRAKIPTDMIGMNSDRLVFSCSVGMIAAIWVHTGKKRLSSVDCAFILTSSTK